MPRRGRIALVGKWEAREREELAKELWELAGELHQTWRQSLRDDLIVEPEPVSKNIA